MPQLTNEQREQLTDFIKQILTLTAVDGNNLIRQTLVAHDNAPDDAIWRENHPDVLAQELVNHLLQEQDLNSLNMLWEKVRKYVPQQENVGCAQMFVELNQAFSGARAVFAKSIQGDVLTGEHARVIHAQTYVEHSYTGGDREILRPFQPPSITQITDQYQHRKSIENLLYALLTNDAGSKQIALVGMGGVGKTALAVQIAHQVRDIFDGGILWANFEYSSDDQAIEAELISFAKAYKHEDLVNGQLNLENKAEAVRDFIDNRLDGRRVLVILNNVEHSRQIKLLAPAGSHNRLLITSRNHTLLPDIHNIVIDTWSADEAINYLTDVLGQNKIDSNIETVQQLIEQVGRLPLAVSIAGALIKESNMSFAEYLEELSDQETQWEVLEHSHESEKSVWDVFSLTYNNLTNDEQILLCSLSIIGGPDFDNIVVAALNSLRHSTTKRRLGKLKSLSLIVPSIQLSNTGETELPDRFRLHPLMKQFISTKLQELEKDEKHQGSEKSTDVRKEFQKRLVEHFTEYVEQNRDPVNFAYIDLEWISIVASLKWAHDHLDTDYLIRGVVNMLGRQPGETGYLDVRDRFAEAIELIKLCYRSVSDLPKTVDNLITKAMVTVSLARILRLQDLTSAEQLLQQEIKDLKLSPQLESNPPLKTQLGYLCIQLSSVFGQKLQLELALKEAQQALELLPLNMDLVRLGAMSNLAMVHQRLGNTIELSNLLEQAIPLAQKLNDRRRYATLVSARALEYQRDGRFAAALADYSKVTQIYKELGNLRGNLGYQINAAQIMMNRREFKNAQLALIEIDNEAGNNGLADIQILAKCHLADLYLRQNEMVQSHNELEGARKLYDANQLDEYLPVILNIDAELNMKNSKFQQARESIEQSITILESTDDLKELGIAYRILAAILFETGDSEEAKEVFQKSMKILKSQEKYEWLTTQLVMAELFLKKPSIGLLEPEAKRIRNSADLELEQLIKDSLTDIA